MSRHPRPPLSFALSAWTLSRVAMRPVTGASAREPVLRAVAAGLRSAWADRDMRICFIYWSAIARRRLVHADGPHEHDLAGPEENAGT